MDSNRCENSNTVVNHIRKPNISKYLKRKDLSHSLKGFLAGLVVIAIAVINLSLFFGLYKHSETEVREKYSRAFATFVEIMSVRTSSIIKHSEHLHFRL